MSIAQKHHSYKLTLITSCLLSRFPNESFCMQWTKHWNVQLSAPGQGLARTFQKPIKNGWPPKRCNQRRARPTCGKTVATKPLPKGRRWFVRHAYCWTLSARRKAATNYYVQIDKGNRNIEKLLHLPIRKTHQNRRILEAGDTRHTIVA